MALVIGPVSPIFHRALHAVLIQGGRMRKKRTRLAEWVVYKSQLVGSGGPNAVCEQWEWDAMTLAEPGRHALVRRGIVSEAEAERVARELPGGTSPGRVVLKAHLSPVGALRR
jgi:hypothetical protein